MLAWGCRSRAMTCECCGPQIDGLQGSLFWLQMTVSLLWYGPPKQSTRVYWSFTNLGLTLHTFEPWCEVFEMESRPACAFDSLFGHVRSADLIRNSNHSSDNWCPPVWLCLKMRYPIPSIGWSSFFLWPVHLGATPQKPRVPCPLGLQNLQLSYNYSGGQALNECPDDLNETYLVAGFIWFYDFPFSWECHGMSSSQLTKSYLYIFFRGVETTNQLYHWIILDLVDW